MATETSGTGETEIEQARRIIQEHQEQYSSPFSTRYGSKEMRRIWSRRNYWDTNARIWVEIARAQSQAGLVTPEQVADLDNHKRGLDVDEIDSREMDRTNPKYTGHDGLAGISVFKDSAPIGGPVIHRGCTTEDPFSNTEGLLIKDSLGLVEVKLRSVLAGSADAIDKTKDLVVMGWTHLQGAEPTTMGYRLARYGQDFLLDLMYLKFLQRNLRGKGIKGAVGTSASFTELLEKTGMSAEEHEKRVMDALGLEPVLISGQTYPRKFTFLTIASLAMIAQTAYNFAADVKILQSSGFGEIAEPRAKKDIGSSAMPFKRNPRHSENIKSLARGLATNIMRAWMDAAEVTLERGLEDSAGKRSYLPESFLAIDEILIRVDSIIRGLEVFPEAIKRNLKNLGTFSATESILMAVCRQGADRQDAHQQLDDHSKAALKAIASGKENPLESLIADDSYFAQYLSKEKVGKIFASVLSHIGDAETRAAKMANLIRERLSNPA
jgi:adenylosuccinate lyase